jgi:hypothetical protein
MDEPELLMQRFVDNELTADERIRFLRTLDHDKALRRRLLDTEGLIAEISQLPRLVPPVGFITQIRDSLRESHFSWFGRVWNALTAPRVLRWNLAGALVVGSALLLFVWLLMYSRQ